MTATSQPNVVNETALHRILTATEATGELSNKKASVKVNSVNTKDLFQDMRKRP